MKNIIWYIFAGTRGGITRARLINLLKGTPANANQIANTLELDYKTVRHHIKVLEKNKLIYPAEKEAYGTAYFLTENMESGMITFDEIWDKIGINLGKR